MPKVNYKGEEITVENDTTFLMSSVAEIPQAQLFVTSPDKYGTRYALNISDLEDSIGNLPITENPEARPRANFSPTDLQALGERSPIIKEQISKYSSAMESTAGQISQETYRQMQIFSRSVGFDPDPELERQKKASYSPAELKALEDAGTNIVDLVRGDVFSSFKQYYENLSATERNAIDNIPNIHTELQRYDLTSFSDLFKLKGEKCLGGTAGICNFICQQMEYFSQLQSISPSPPKIVEAKKAPDEVSAALLAEINALREKEAAILQEELVALQKEELEHKKQQEAKEAAKNAPHARLAASAPPRVSNTAQPALPSFTNGLNELKALIHQHYAKDPFYQAIHYALKIRDPNKPEYKQEIQEELYRILRVYQQQNSHAYQKLVQQSWVQNILPPDEFHKRYQRDVASRLPSPTPMLLNPLPIHGPLFFAVAVTPSAPQPGSGLAASAPPRMPSAAPQSAPSPSSFTQGLNELKALIHQNPGDPFYQAMNRILNWNSHYNPADYKQNIQANLYRVVRVYQHRPPDDAGLAKLGQQAWLQNMLPRDEFDKRYKEEKSSPVLPSPSIFPDIDDARLLPANGPIALGAAVPFAPPQAPQPAKNPLDEWLRHFSYQITEKIKQKPSLEDLSKFVDGINKQISHMHQNRVKSYMELCAHSSNPMQYSDALKVVAKLPTQQGDLLNRAIASAGGANKEKEKIFLAACELPPRTPAVQPDMPAPTAPVYRKQ